jgi:mediator of RNA polymerase II transcription subunit 8
MLGHDKCPALRNLTVLPLLLSPERDEQLFRLTEQRVPMFSHDLVPDYLRTKPDPEVEQKMLQLEHKATNMTFETVQVQLILILGYPFYTIRYTDVSKENTSCESLIWLVLG